LYVRHATVAEFEGVSVEDFPQLVVSREAFINQRYSLNYVLLIAKLSIYCSCLHDKKLSFNSFLILLKEKRKTQKEFAFKNNILF